jgi:catechol 1,2-dioxygenase
MDRKKFIINSSLSIFALSAFGSVVQNENGEFEGECTTTSDILGPFYRANSPLRSDLTYEGLEGTQITIKGKVYQSDCVTIVKDALVEIWHCNTLGEYDNDSDDYNQRGSINTDKDGKYEFKTIVPGKYLNGNLYRPAHIHFRITASGNKDLVSQIYFKGDPHIIKDPWASKEKAKLRILQLYPEDIKGNLSVNFDIYLEQGA